MCIIREETFNKKYHYITRNSEGNNVDGGNSYTWCELKKYHEAYDRFRNMDYKNKIRIIEDYILPAKIENKKLPSDDSKKKTSEAIFIEKVQNIRCCIK